MPGFNFTPDYRIQWNLSNMDAIGTKILSAVYLFQGENNVYLYKVGTRPYISEVSFKRGSTVAILTLTKVTIVYIHTISTIVEYSPGLLLLVTKLTRYFLQPLVHFHPNLWLPVFQFLRQRNCMQPSNCFCDLLHHYLTPHFFHC